ncbi:hypothetical protein PG987_003359 [Apiospora arundinis]
MASGSNPPPEDAGEGPGDSAPKFGVGERLTVPGEGEDGVNLNNYQFSFQQNHLDAGTGKSVFIEADSIPRARDVDWESVTSSITNYRVENGRTYHAYKDGSYLYPNDTDEQDRQQFEHVILQHLMGGRLYFAPWSQEHPPRRVLDIGTGTGIWAVEVGFEYPTAKVLGTDLSAIQPTDVPPNVEFYVEDTRDPWHWYRQEDRFDYIHTRMTLGCWEDLKVDVVQKSFDQLEPGGWFESQDLLSSILCDDGTMTDDNPPQTTLRRYRGRHGFRGPATSQRRPVEESLRRSRICGHYGIRVQSPHQRLAARAAVERIGKDVGGQLPTRHTGSYVRPVGADTKTDEKSNGGRSTLAFPPPTIANLWQMLLLDVRKAISDTSVHAYQKFFIVLARKPYPDEVRQPAAASSTTEDISMADC